MKGGILVYSCKPIKRYELEMGVNGAKEMQLEIAETSVGAGYMFPK